MSRRAVRHDIVSRLKAIAGVTAICPASSIFESRATRLPVGTMPAIVVSVPRTRRTRLSAASMLPMFEVTHSVAIDCFVSGTSDSVLADTLDWLAEEVLDALLTDPSWVMQFEAVSGASEEIVVEGDADARYGLARITLDVQLTETYEPAVLDDLATVHADFDVDGDGVASDPDDVGVTITGLDQ